MNSKTGASSLLTKRSYNEGQLTGASSSGMRQLASGATMIDILLNNEE